VIISTPSSVLSATFFCEIHTAKQKTCEIVLSFSLYLPDKAEVQELPHVDATMYSQIMTTYHKLNWKSTNR